MSAALPSRPSPPTPLPLRWLTGGGIVAADACPHPNPSPIAMGEGTASRVVGNRGSVDPDSVSGV